MCRMSVITSAVSMKSSSSESARRPLCQKSDAGRTSAAAIAKEAATENGTRVTALETSYSRK